MFLLDHIGPEIPKNQNKISISKYQSHANTNLQHRHCTPKLSIGRPHPFVWQDFGTGFPGKKPKTAAKVIVFCVTPIVPESTEEKRRMKHEQTWTDHNLTTNEWLISTKITTYRGHSIAHQDFEMPLKPASRLPHATSSFESFDSFSATASGSKASAAAALHKWQWQHVAATVNGTALWTWKVWAKLAQVC